MKRTAVIVTCEHGGNAIPRAYAPLFRGWKGVLGTHRGWDIGAAKVAERLSRALSAPLFVATTSRLLVDLNRSTHHRRVFSDVTRTLSPEERARIVREHHDPHRKKVEGAIDAALRSGARVLHVAVHSFTPVLDGVRRNADVALLYDPARAPERELCAAWRAAMKRAEPSYVVRQNYPYRGKGDGFTTTLRRRYRPALYSGIEIEMNQADVGARAGVARMSELLARSLRDVL